MNDGDAGRDGGDHRSTAATPSRPIWPNPWTGRPTGGVVVIHHMPGYDEATKEITRKFAAHGYLAICPNLYCRQAPGASPDDAAAAVRAQGGVPDDRLVGDVAGAIAHLRSLESSNGKVATIGYCSGGRQSFLAACSLELDAAVDCYGAFVVGSPPEGLPAQGRAASSTRPRTSRAPCSGCSERTTSTPRPTRWPSWRGSSPRPAKSSSSIPTRAPAMPSSPPTGRATGRKPPSRAGSGSGTSSAAT